MVTLLHPGVYVSEVPGGLRSIEGAPTSTTIFVGETERGPLGPTRITSRADYERLFGGYFRVRESSPPGTSTTRLLTAYAMDAFYANGGSTAYMVRAMDEADTAKASRRGTTIVASSPGVWGDSIAVAFLKSSGPETSPPPSAMDARFKIAVVYAAPGPGSERRVVEIWDRLSIKPGDENYVVDVLARSAFIRWNTEGGPATTVPAPDPVGSSGTSGPTEDDIVDGATSLTGGTGGGDDLDPADYGTILSEQLAGVDDAALLVATCDALLGTDESIYTSMVGQFVDYAEGRPRQRGCGSPRATPCGAGASRSTGAGAPSWWPPPGAPRGGTFSSSATGPASVARRPRRSRPRARSATSATSTPATSRGCSGRTSWSATSWGLVATRRPRCLRRRSWPGCSPASTAGVGSGRRPLAPTRRSR